MWTRLAVDVDTNGNVCGVSTEHHDENGATDCIRVLSHGPFDTPQEALGGAWLDALDRGWVQLTLFP